MSSLAEIVKASDVLRGLVSSIRPGFIDSVHTVEKTDSWPPQAHQ